MVNIESIDICKNKIGTSQVIGARIPPQFNYDIHGMQLNLANNDRTKSMNNSRGCYLILVSPFNVLERVHVR